ncbi:LysR family transcriptional regulator [Streptomyces sp. NPDC097619]|uniref:LysR family transcriptional regulator n=1 Tax=Streptomyces sp. NPDC097619 TaxID=3157228 RepID=UPI003324AAE7
MDPHLLRTFVTVVELRSFSAAARRLGYTQSAVSQHIAALEADLGTRLVERRPVAPTAAGERLGEHAGPLLLRLDAARADLARLDRTRPGSLTVAASPAALTPALVRALAPHGDGSPGPVVTLRVRGREAVVREVMTGAADLGLVDGTAAPSDPLPLPDTGPLRTVGVAEEPLGVLFPADHPLAGRAAVRLPDLADAHWIDAPDTAAPLEQLRAVSRAEGFRPRLRYTGADLRGLGLLVAAGHGLAALPVPVAAGLADTVVVPVTVPVLVHRTEALHPRGPAPAVEGVLAALARARGGAPRV